MKYRQSSFLLIILFHGIFDFLTRTFAFQTPQFASSACSHYLTRLSNLDHSQSTTRCFASAEEEEATNYDEEETLLKIHLSVLPVVSMDAAMERVSAYCRSFPFAAVLPVQPLTYVRSLSLGWSESFRILVWRFCVLLPTCSYQTRMVVSTFGFCAKRPRKKGVWMEAFGSWSLKLIKVGLMLWPSEILRDKPFPKCFRKSWSSKHLSRESVARLQTRRARLL